MTQMDADKRDSKTYRIIGAAMETHRTLGAGFLEAVYQEALAVEFDRQDIAYRREAPIKITYKSRLLSIGYRVDFLCFDSIIVEIKALARLTTIEEAQIINYLKSSELDIGLVLNFGATRLEYKRFALSQIHLRTSASSADRSLQFIFFPHFAPIR